MIVIVFTSLFTRHFSLVTSFFASVTAPIASSLKPSAPISSAQLLVTGAPPTITLTFGRRPKSSSASMTVFCPTIVVVSSAETPTISALTSRAFCGEFLERHIDAEIVDLEPAGREHRGDEVLANLVDVALHRAQHDLAQHLPLRAAPSASPAPARPRRPSSLRRPASDRAGTSRLRRIDRPRN